MITHNCVIGYMCIPVYSSFAVHLGVIGYPTRSCLREIVLTFDVATEVARFNVTEIANGLYAVKFVKTEKIDCVVFEEDVLLVLCHNVVRVVVESCHNVENLSGDLLLVAPQARPIRCFDVAKVRNDFGKTKRNQVFNFPLTQGLISLTLDFVRRRLCVAK